MTGSESIEAMQLRHVEHERKVQEAREAIERVFGDVVVGDVQINTSLVKLCGMIDDMRASLKV